MLADKIKERIEANLKTAFTAVETKDNVHFYATVVSEEFINMNRIEQHKKVLSLFENEINSAEIHALSVKTFTPDKWQSIQS